MSFKTKTEEYPFVKIGYSYDVEKRRRQIQTSIPYEVEVLGVIECKNEKAAAKREMIIHRRSSHLHEINEWYRNDPSLFNNSLLEKYNHQPKKQVREPITIKNLYGESETFFDMDSRPRCFFYNDLPAHLRDNYENSMKVKLPFRTMPYPTYGKQLLLPWSDETDRVWISEKKHKENLEEKAWKNKKIPKSLPFE